MNDKLTPPRFGKVPPTYDARFMDRCLRDIERVFGLMLAIGELQTSGIRMQDIATSPTGLPPGTMWYDEPNNTLRLIP